MKLAFYIGFNENCKSAIDFYKQVFNVEENILWLHDESNTVDESKWGKVFHAELVFEGKYDIYMSDQFQEIDKSGYNFTIMYNNGKDASEKFDLLSKNGEIINPMKKMDYGPTIGKVRDQFGVSWYIVVSDEI